MIASHHIWAAALSLVLGCTEDRPGGRCELLTGCKPPLECVRHSGKSLCLAACGLERDPTTGATKRICTVPDTVPAEGYTAGGKFIGSQGCLCVPKPE